MKAELSENNYFNWAQFIRDIIDNEEYKNRIRKFLANRWKTAYESNKDINLVTYNYVNKCKY